MKTCIFTLLTTFHHVLLYLCTELFNVISAEVVAQFISSRAFFFELFKQFSMAFFSSSSPFQNYQLFPDHLAEAHTVGPYSPPGSGGAGAGAGGGCWRFTESQRRRNLPDPPSSRLPLFVSSPRTRVLTHSHSSC